MLDEVSPLVDLDEEVDQGAVPSVIQNDYPPDVDLAVTLSVTPDGLTDEPSLTSSHPAAGLALSTPQQGDLKDLLAELSDIFFRYTRLHQ